MFEKTKRATRRLARKLGLTKKKRYVDHDTRRIVKDAVTKAVFTQDEPEEKEDSGPMRSDITADSTHVNFNTKINSKNPINYTTNYYTGDGKLLYSSDNGELE